MNRLGFVVLAMALAACAVAPARADSSTRDLDGFMNFLSDSVSPTTGLALSGGMLALGRAEEFEAAQVFIVALAVSSGITGGLKFTFNRDRPSGTTTRSNSSFPSGHATGSFAMATVLGHQYPRMAPALYAWAGLVAYSRLYKERHHPTDVVAGALIGMGTARLALRYKDKYTLPGHGLLGFFVESRAVGVTMTMRF